MAQTVAVAGATGFVGRHIVRELLARGSVVRALVRDPEKARGIRDERVQLVMGGPGDPAAALVAGASACVNAVGILREARGSTFNQAHVETTRSLVGACLGAGVRRFVQVSALGVSEEGTTGYQRSKFDAEQIVRRSGLDWTILRPSLIHGRDSGFMTLAKGWVTGNKQPWFFMPYFTRGVVTSDVPLAAIRRESAQIAPVAV